MKNKIVTALVAGALWQSTIGKIAAQDIDSMPPVVVKTVPQAGSKNVAPGEMEIKVTFSKEMRNGSWSWSTAWKDSTPEIIGKPHYEADKKTCVVKVKLEPDKTYGYWLNSQKFVNFKDAQGHSAVPYLLAFATSAAGERDHAINNGNAEQEGWQLWQARKFDEAAAKFREAIESSPTNANARNGLGWALFNSGKADEAIEPFEKAVSLQPDHPAALNGLGQIYLSKRNYDDAEKFLLKAAPKAPAAWYGLARLYLLKGKFEDAERWAQNIIDAGQADETVKKMLEAAQKKKLSEGLRLVIEPPAQ